MLKKHCDYCKLLKPIWKSHGKLKLCKSCWGRRNPPVQLKRVPLPRAKSRVKPVSDKKQKLDLAYKALRENYLKTHSQCVAHLPGCSLIGNEIHHMSGKATEELWLDTSRWILLCHNCHRKVTDDGKMAIELGLSTSRLTKVESEGKLPEQSDNPLNRR